MWHLCAKGIVLFPPNEVETESGSLKYHLPLALKTQTHLSQPHFLQVAYLIIYFASYLYEPRLVHTLIIGMDTLWFQPPKPRFLNYFLRLNPNICSNPATPDTGQ